MMQLVPAIDLRDGHCVQLAQGLYAQEKVRLPDPVGEAAKWVARGAEWLHVVDLDRALGVGNNFEITKRILERVMGDARVQVGGGVRDEEDIDDLLDAGATLVVVGTRAVTDAAFLRRIASRYGDRVVVAVDARDGEVVVKGWTEASGRRLDEFAREAASLGVGGLLFTDVGREGLLGGANVDGVRALVDAVPKTRVIASGGVATVDDLLRLQSAGAWGAVVGMAFYTGKINFAAAKQSLAAVAGTE